jgi:hypothetical protein
MLLIFVPPACAALLDKFGNRIVNSMATGNRIVNSLAAENVSG